MNKERIYMKAGSGSRLYGTAGAVSDYDHKIILAPSVKEILLGKASNSLQTIAEEDNVYWTYQKWVELLVKMDSNAYEVYLANANLELPHYPLREILWDNRAPAIGFVDGSLTRYAVRGKRIEGFELAVQVINDSSDLIEAAQRLAGQEGVTISLDPMGVTLIRVYGKAIPVTSKKSEALKLYQKQIDNAGQRTINSMGSKDWKGIAHGLRVARQMVELVKTGNIVFPLGCAEELRDIRNGLVDYDDAVNRVQESVDHLRSLPPSDHLTQNENDAHVAAQYSIVEYHNSLVLGE